MKLSKPSGPAVSDGPPCYDAEMNVLICTILMAAQGPHTASKQRGPCQGDSNRHNQLIEENEALLSVLLLMRNLYIIKFRVYLILSLLHRYITGISEEYILSSHLYRCFSEETNVLDPYAFM